MSSSSSNSLRSAINSNLKGFRPTFSDYVTHKPLFNTFTTTAEELQLGLNAGKWKSTQIVEEYHRAICKYNGYLNAVYELAEGALARAAEMDKLRAEGKVLGALHGIPILIKVSSKSFRSTSSRFKLTEIIRDNINIDPSLGMGTTGGAMALVGAESASSATIVEKVSPIVKITARVLRCNSAP